MRTRDLTRSRVLSELGERVLSRRPARGRPVTWNAWVRAVWNAYTAAAHAWELAAESASNGWTTELVEYAADNPRPTYRAFLVSMSGSVY